MKNKLITVAFIYCVTAGAGAVAAQGQHDAGADRAAAGSADGILANKNGGLGGGFGGGGLGGGNGGGVGTNGEGGA